MFVAPPYFLYAKFTDSLASIAKKPEGNWGKIINENDSMWLASWMDFLTQKRKIRNLHLENQEF